MLILKTKKTKHTSIKKLTLKNRLSNYKMVLSECDWQDK